jgi:3',5'-cyclic-AMP phosphodiesterase
MAANLDRAVATATLAETDRRGFLKCMAWAGTGVVWAVSGGLLSSATLARAATGLGPGGALAQAAPPTATFTFAQISDTHIGFGAQPNPDPIATLQESIARINALNPAPAFVLHTGDLTHAQKAGAFDIVNELLKGLNTSQVFFTPGEHDVFVDDGVEFLNRFGQGTLGQGWRSFDHGGVHFAGLVNTLSFKGEAAGVLGDEQLEWLERDLAPLSSSTPVVVYTHIPLWVVYPEWGWLTEDAERALAALRRFGSVTVLNGHIHQVMQKVEGNISFYTAMSTAFPQPAPGTAPSPGPRQDVSSDQVRQMLGLRNVTFVPGTQPLAVVDATLA